MGSTGMEENTTRRSHRRRTPSQEELLSLRQIKQALSTNQQQEIKKHFIVDSVWLQTMVNLMTFLNALQMGFEADHPDLTVWLVCENVFTAGFAAEMAVKLWVLRRNYFHDVANCLDCFVTVLGILDCWIMAPIGGAAAADLQSLSILRILRLARLVRLLKLIHSFKPFVIVIRGVARAMQTAAYVFALCAIIFFVFAIFFTQYLGRQAADLYPGYSEEVPDIDEQEFLANYNPYICFGTMLSSMLTLFNMSIMAEWTEIVRPIAVKQPIYLPIFFFFAAFVSFGVMSVLIAAIVDVVNEESKNLESEYALKEIENKMNVMNQLEDLIFDLDSDGSGELNLDELEKAFQSNESLIALLKDLNLPLGWSAPEFRDLLDADGDRLLQRDEFQAGLFRILFSDDSQQLCIMAASINQVKRLIKDQNQKFVMTHSAILSDIACIKAALGIPPELQKQPKDERLSVQSADGVENESSTGSSFCVVSDQQTNAFATPTTKASVDSTLIFPNSGINEVTSGLQLHEAIKGALAVVKECIHEEFAAIKPSLESEFEGFGAQKCSSPVEVAETQSPFPASPSGPKQHPAGREELMASHSGRREDSQPDSFKRVFDVFCSFGSYKPSESLANEPSPRPKHKHLSL